MSHEMVEELNGLWMKAEGNFNAFDKAVRELIGKAFKVEPWRLQRNVSYNRILTGEFMVEESKHGHMLIVNDE